MYHPSNFRSPFMPLLSHITIFIIDSHSWNVCTFLLCSTRYYHANSVGYEDPRNCKDLCRRTHFCVITNVDYQDYERCIQTVFGPSSSAARLAFKATPITSALPLTLPILLLYPFQLNNIFRWWWSSSSRLSSLPLHL